MEALDYLANETSDLQLVEDFLLTELRVNDLVKFKIFARTACRTL